jgi:phosphate transport system permease protein
MNGSLDLTALGTESLQKRHKVAKTWSNVFLSSIIISVLVLLVLLLTVINDSIGYVVVQYENDPVVFSSVSLDSLTKSDLIKLLSTNLSTYRWRTLQQEINIDKLTIEGTLNLVEAELLKPTYIASYSLLPSLLNRKGIYQEIASTYPKATIEFHSWLNFKFLISSMSTIPENAGVRTAILGSLWIVLIAMCFSIPIGVGAAIYLEEYATLNRLNKIIQTNIDNLAGIPSIIYGILGLAIFVRALKPLTSGAIFGLDQTNGRTIISAGLTIALLLLPPIIINAQEALRSVPFSLRQASYGVGATRWQTIWHHVLPAALPGILTGAILAISRGIGETAPLILVGASSFINKDPTGIFSNFTALPLQIYYWTQRPQDQFRNAAAAAILVLLIMLLSLNAVAILLRNRYARQA